MASLTKPKRPTDIDVNATVNYIVFFLYVCWFWAPREKEPQKLSHILQLHIRHPRGEHQSLQCRYEDHLPVSFFANATHSLTNLYLPWKRAQGDDKKKKKKEATTEGVRDGGFPACFYPNASPRGLICSVASGSCRFKAAALPTEEVANQPAHSKLTIRLFLHTVDWFLKGTVLLFPAQRHSSASTKKPAAIIFYRIFICTNMGSISALTVYVMWAWYIYFGGFGCVGWGELLFESLSSNYFLKCYNYHCPYNHLSLLPMLAKERGVLY